MRLYAAENRPVCVIPHLSATSVTDRFIPELINMGYQLVTVSELAEARGVKMEAGETYYSFKP